MLLLDTQSVIWLAQAPELISHRAQSAIIEVRQMGGLAISDKTLWEIAWLKNAGRIEVQGTLREFLLTIERNFAVLPITAAVAERSTLFSASYPKDPADRIIGATALANGIELITADKAIRASGEVPCIW